MCSAYRVHDEGDYIITIFPLFSRKPSERFHLLHWESGEVYQSKNEIKFLKTKLFADLVFMV